MMRLFGPFNRPFFVPWQTVHVHRQKGLFGKNAKISFGQPVTGVLTVTADVADRLARGAGAAWPEAEQLVGKSEHDAGASIFKEWVLSTVLAALFFTFAPRIAFGTDADFPIAIAIVFPAVFFGIGAIVRYMLARSSRRNA